MDTNLNTTLIPLRDHIWAIDQEMVRSFLITGTRQALLLDTGAAPCDLMGIIRSVTDLPVTLVQTHGDGDHTANSSLFSVIYAHPAEYSVLTRFRPELADRLQAVYEGHAFDLGRTVLEVIEAPGHTPGSICLIDRTEKLLFSGDTLSYGPVFLFGEHRDIRVYRKTLDKLAALQGYDVIYPCHNTCPVTPAVIQDLKDAVDGTLAGTISGTPMDGPPLPDGARPLCYTSGTAGILYI